MKNYGTDPKLDRLVDSDNWEDRAKVAEQGYGLDKLINDEDYFVRRTVAKHGYGLDKLVLDENEDVRAAVDKYLAEHGLTIEEWCKQNKKSTSAIQNLKDFIHKVEDSSKIKIETSYESTDAFLKIHLTNHMMIKNQLL